MLAIKFLLRLIHELSDIDINSIENFGKESIKTVGETTAKSVDSIANSNLGLLIGLALIIFVFLKFKLIFFVRQGLNHAQNVIFLFKKSELILLKLDFKIPIFSI